MGSDITVVNAARVSFNKESQFNPDGTLSDNDECLIKYLAKHNHWSPFSHPQITLRETIPIFLARQRFKHMVGFTYNEVSRRYVDDAPEFYYPDGWRTRPEGTLKQGSGSSMVEYLTIDGVQGLTTEYYKEYIDMAKDMYKNMIKHGVAPEQARMILPQSMLTSYYVTGSLAAFARAYKQRSDTHAQKEAQELAILWDSIIKPLYPSSWEALTA